MCEVRILGNPDVLPVASEPTALRADNPASRTPPVSIPVGKPGPSPELPEEQTKKIAGEPRKWLLWGVGILLGAALAAYLLRNVVLGTPTDVYAVTSGELLQTVVASGRVISPQRVSVALQGTGRVLRVAVVEGQTVEAGQLLIELDNSDSRAGLAQASASVAQAQAKLRQLNELGQPQAVQALAQAQALAVQAGRALTRSRELLAQGFVSQAAVDEAQRAEAVAKSQVTSAQVQVASSARGGSDAALNIAALAQAQAGEALARVKLAQGQVLAPSAGVLISRSVEVGDIVQPGKALMVFAARGTPQLLIQIDEKNLSKIALGQSAYGSADAFADQRFDAVVAYINPGIDATRGSVEVKLSVPRPPVYLRQDMTVSVDIETARRPAALVVPSQAVEDAAKDQPWVLVVRDKHLVKQFVTLGLRGDDRLEVLSGLAAGELVVPVPKVGVKAGDRVRARVVAVSTAASAPGLTKGRANAPAPAPAAPPTAQ